MPTRLHLRTLTDDEQREIRQMSRSRTVPTRTVERAQIIWCASQGQSVSQIAEALSVGAKLVRRWMTRFHLHGLSGLLDQPRSGRPAKYTREQVGLVVATALTHPQEVGQPFGSWTFERLTVYLNEVCGLPIQHSRVHEILQAEGLRWRQQETWFGARVDPTFAEKRGASKRSTSTPQQAAW